MRNILLYGITGDGRIMKKQMPYIISQEPKSGQWYCHMRGYDYIPVFGSIGDKKKAKKICDMYNRSMGAKE